MQLPGGGCTRGRSPLVGGAAARGVPALSAGNGTGRGVGGTRPPRLSPGGGNGKGGASVPCCRRRFVCSCGARGNRFGAPAPRTTLENVAVVEKPVEHRTDSGGITQQPSPVFDGTIRGQQSARPF